jgi:tetratricopeptide (TPR) repeat protein
VSKKLKYTDQVTSRNFLREKRMRFLRIVHCFLCLSLITYPLSLFSQNKKIDSLQKVLANAKDDTNRVKTLVVLAKALDNNGDLQQADSVAKVSLSLAIKLNDKRGMCTAKATLGMVYDDEAKLDEALTVSLEAVKLSEELNDKELIVKTSGDLALVYYDKGDYPKALEYNFNVLKIAREIHDWHSEANILGNLGLVYWNRGELDKAIDYFEQALKIFRENKDNGGIAMNTGNLGVIYFNKKNFTKALEYYDEALKMNIKLKRKMGIIRNTGNIGGVYEELGQYDTSRAYFNRALKMAEGLGDKPSIIMNTGNIGETYMKEKKDVQAEDYLTRALSMSSALGELEYIKAYSLGLSNVFADEGKWEKALDMYKKYSVIKDTLISTDKNKEIGKMEAKADYDKQLALQQAEEDKKTVLAAADSKRQRIISAFTGAVALAIAIIAILIFRSLRITRKQKLLIELQKTEVEKQKILVEEQKGVVEQQKLLVEEKNKEIVDSINYAKRLQDAILPPLSEVIKALPESFILYKPKDIVAGDFYWLERVTSLNLFQGRDFERSQPDMPSPLGEGKDEVILIAAADCTGHGVPGALVSVVCSNALNQAVKEFGISEPGKILDKVRDLVLETFGKSEDNVQDGMDISLLALTLPSPKGEGATDATVAKSSYKAKTDTSLPLGRDGVRVQWSGANNSLWYILNGQMIEIAPDKQPIGKYYNTKPFTTHTINIPKGSPLGSGGAVFYLFTDGYADQFGGPKGKKFKYAQLQEKLLAISHQPLAEQKTILEQTFEQWKGKLEQVDDVLVIGIRV